MMSWNPSSATPGSKTWWQGQASDGKGFCGFRAERDFGDLKLRGLEFRVRRAEGARSGLGF